MSRTAGAYTPSFRTIRITIFYVRLWIFVSDLCTLVTLSVTANRAYVVRPSSSRLQFRTSPVRGFSLPPFLCGALFISPEVL